MSIQRARVQMNAWLQGIDQLAEWKSIVEVQFDSLWDEILEQVDDDDDNDGEDTEDGNDEKRNLRVCGATLKSIIHPGHLVRRQDGRTNYDEVLKLIEDAQKSLTNVETELSVLTQMATILIASGEGLAEGKSVILDIRRLLPDGYRLLPDGS
ncbi:hypothetical protein BGZ73_001513, partial [Actinomortierella ambigua]